ncbi:MAG: proliferating cell nuclear antigen (pcna) [Nitrososphaerales archaeon]
MVFVAKTKTPNEWKVIANTISTLVEEATFEATVEGVSFRAMDPSHVALVDLNWPNAAFDQYECDKEYKLTVRVDEFAKLIKRAGSKGSIEISAEDDDHLTVKLQNGYKKEFKIHLIESSSEASPIPKLSFNTKVTLKEDSLADILSDINVLADHIIIESTQDGVTFLGKSDAGQASVTLEKSSEQLIAMEVKENSRATYSLQYLVNMVKAAGAASENITAEYSNKMPLRLEFQLGDSGGRIHFYLAPRIEER